MATPDQTEQARRLAAEGVPADDGRFHKSPADTRRHSTGESAASDDPFADVRISETAVQRLFSHAKGVQTHVVIDGLSAVPEGVVRGGVNLVARASTVRDAMVQAEIVAARWRELGVFKSVSWGIEPLGIPDSELARAGGRDDNLVVRYRVDEARSRWDIGIMTSATAVPELQIGVKNLLRRPWSVSFAWLPSAVGSVPSGELRLTSLLPAFGQKCDWILGRKVETRLTTTRPCPIADSETITEAKVVVSSELFPPSSDPEAAKCTSTLSAGLQDRTLAVRDLASVPASIRALFGSDTKLFTRASWRYNGVGFNQNPQHRNLYGLPVSGITTSSRTELLASLPHDGSGVSDLPSLASLFENAFVKHEIQATKYLQLLPTVVLDLNVAAGGVFSLQSLCESAQLLPRGAASSNRSVPLADRMFTGWRHVRGFRALGPNAIDSAYDGSERQGPKVFRALGGDAMWAASAVLNFPFPLFPHNGYVASHLFANVGHVAHFGGVQQALENWRDLFRADGIAASIGGGLVLSSMPALSSAGAGRLEASVAYPFTLEGGSFKPRQDLFDGAGVATLFEKLKWGLHWTTAEA